MKNVNNLYKNTSMKLSTVAVVLLSAFGVSTIANAATPEHFISVAPGATDTTKGNYNNDGAKSDDSVAIGKDAAAGFSKDVAVGDNAKANDDTTSKDQKIGGATAIGADTVARGNGASAYGYGAKANGANASALGNQANATGIATTAVGVSTQATGAYSAAVGSNAKATGYASVGIGLATDADAGATGPSSVSIGYQAGASIQESVALGAHSKTTVNSGVKGYDPSSGNKTDATWQSTKGAVSVGDVDKNITRQITSVAAGTNDTDAVNVAQLKSLGTKVDANTTAIETNKTAIETNKTAIETNKTEIGKNKTAIEANKTAIDNNKTEIGKNKTAIETNKTEIGKNKTAIETNKTEIGKNKTAIEANVKAIETNAKAIDTNKANIKTNADNISANTNRLNAHSNAINELRGNVNLLNKDLRGGVASAISHASVPQSTKAGAIGVGVGTGFYGGQSAVSLGVSGVTPNENWVFKASVSTNSRGNYGVGAGALYQW